MIGTHIIPVIFGHPFGAPHAAGFFVGDTEVDEVALGREAFVGELAEHDGHRRGEVEHVNCTSAPNFAVDDVGCERVVGPPVSVDRHDVGMAHEAQRGCARI